jgi:hypothetical protein
MANPVYFISPDEIKKQSYIDTNVDQKLIAPTIIMVQDTHIHPLVGTDIFNDLRDGVIDANLSEDYEALMKDYIWPVILWYVMYESPTFISYQFKNKDLVRKNSENSEPATLQEIQFIMGRLKDKAEIYSNRLVRYLCAYPDKFPKYYQHSGKSDTIYPTKTTFDTGWYLD